MRTALALALALAALPALAQEAGDPEAGPAVFRKCRTCHQVGEGARNGVGPELNGVLGRAVASVEGFRYSPALTALGGIWDAAALAAFLADPRAAVPGNRMSFAGLRSEKEVADVIAYLATLGAAP